MSLTERERYILHACTAMTVSSMEKDKPFNLKAILNAVLKDRCRHLTPEEAQEILSDIMEEVMAGSVVYEEMMASLRGEDLEKFK